MPLQGVAAGRRVGGRGGRGRLRGGVREGRRDVTGSHGGREEDSPAGEGHSSLCEFNRSQY